MGHYETIITKGRDPLTIAYFDNLNNEDPNKYKKILKIEKKIIVI
jgi:hypothetical protein